MVVAIVAEIAVAEHPGFPTLEHVDDELFPGNSHGVNIVFVYGVNQLLDGGAVGLITTHDLLLTRMVEDLRPRAINLHFGHQVVKGCSSFDYKLELGAAKEGNALELMRRMGLDV